MWVRVPPRVLFEVWNLFRPPCHDENWRASLQTPGNMARFRGKRAAPGIEPGTSRTRSENHATRPSSQLEACCFVSASIPVAVVQILFSDWVLEHERCLANVEHVVFVVMSEFRHYQNDTCGIRTHAGRPHRLSRPTP